MVTFNSKLNFVPILSSSQYLIIIIAVSSVCLVYLLVIIPSLRGYNQYSNPSAVDKYCPLTPPL